jgi:hypothetical protein
MTCTECGAPLGRTGKCVGCILRRACASGGGADSDDGTTPDSLGRGAGDGIPISA